MQNHPRIHRFVPPIVVALLVTLLAAPAVQAASMVTRVEWSVANSGNSPTMIIPGVNRDFSEDGAGALVSFGLTPGDFVGTGVVNPGGPLPSMSAFAEIDGRRLRAYAELVLSPDSCNFDGVFDEACGVSSGNILWSTNSQANAFAAIVDDLLIEAGPGFDGMSGLLQIPVTTDGRLFAEQSGTFGTSAGLQTSLTGRTARANDEILIDSFGNLNVRFTFGELVTYVFSLEAFASHIGQVDDVADAAESIADFGSTAEIGEVTRLLVDADGNGSFETTLDDGFSIDSALGIDYLNAPEPRIAALLIVAALVGARPRRR